MEVMDGRVMDGRVMDGRVMDGRVMDGRMMDGREVTLGGKDLDPARSFQLCIFYHLGGWKKK